MTTIFQFLTSVQLKYVINFVFYRYSFLIRFLSLFKNLRIISILLSGPSLPYIFYFIHQYWIEVKIYKVYYFLKYRQIVGFNNLQQLYQSLMFKQALIISSILSLINIIVSLVIGHTSPFYNPNLRAYFSGVISSVIGIVANILVFNIQKFQYTQNIIKAIAIFILVFSILALVFQSLLGFYFGVWGCLLCLSTPLIMAYKIKFGEKTVVPVDQSYNSTKCIPLNIQGQVSSTFGQNIEQKQEDNRCCTTQKCRSCCFLCCLVTTLLFLALFTIVSIVIFSNLKGYPAYGTVFQISNTQLNQKYYLHGYCKGKQNLSRPTIILEHGGGSNSMAFAQLGEELSTKNWKFCSYDRLGYGRSSPIPRHLTIEEKAFITNQVINKLLQNDVNKNIVIGGWSAGVEISQIYTKIYPNNVKGLIFIDGYPDYLDLMSIYDNKTQKIVVNVAGITEIVRILQPLGLAFITGSNQINNESIKQYYRAYYQTGYFWESQYFDVTNPYETTVWLTESGKNDPKPYPNSKLDINWPNINLPLLILPAQSTVNGTDKRYQGMYYLQCVKYLQKCSSVNKTMVIMEGDHGFVLSFPGKVATQIDTFFGPIF